MPRYAESPFILRWWTREHDTILEGLITRRRWLWYWSASEAITAHTPSAVLEEWKETDPACRIRVWYNVLMNFAVARAHALGLDRSIRRGDVRSCLLCGETFLEESLPVPLVDRLGMDRLEFCSPCLRDTVLQGSGHPSVPAEEITEFLRDLATALGRVPTQAHGEGRVDLLALDAEKRVSLLRILRRKPTIGRVKQIFGSWREALVAAQVLDAANMKPRRE